MKKILGLLLAAVVAFPASAAVIKNVELKGEVQTIASDVKYGMYETYNRGAKTRAIAGLSFDVVEDVKANLLFQYAYNWGDHNYTNNGFDSAEGMRLVNANLVLSNLFCCLEATVGRQFYGEDNSPIIYFGPNHYNAEGMGLATALDAVTVRYSDDFKTFTLLAGKVADASKGAVALDIGDGYYLRSNIWGADLKLNLTDALTANIYGYDVTGATLYEYDDDLGPIFGDDHKHMGVYGAKLGLDTEAFRMSAEYARNFNGHRLVKERADVPYMVKGDIAADINAFTARGTFVYAKEGFYSLGNYAPGMMFGHLLSNYGAAINVFNYGSFYGDGGLRLFNVGFDVRPSEKWTVSLDGFSFHDRFGRHAATYEVDLTAKYAYNEYVEMFG
ncbi:MAG: hypothetical protein J5826_09065, partial [Bacteroidales bacterium]|nr:hypothetical protein [Bacteroidales bacterium]MBO4675446.1 hypothetical protein [Elusimicrobiaceae bacterium]